MKSKMNETKALTMWLKTLIEMKNKMKTSKYTPFGEEWKKELSKLSKKRIIDIAQGIGNESERLKELLRENHLPGISDAEIEKFAFDKYHDVEDSRWFEPLQVGAKWSRDKLMNKNEP